MEKVSKFFASNFARSRFLGRIQNRVLKKKKKIIGIFATECAPQISTFSPDLQLRAVQRSVVNVTRPGTTYSNLVKLS